MLIENRSNPVCCALCKKKKKKNNCSGAWQFWKGFFFENKKQHSQLLLLLFYASVLFYGTPDTSFTLSVVIIQWNPSSYSSNDTCALFFMNHLCLGTIMHHINIGSQHFLSSCAAVFPPHKVHFEQQVKACHQLYVASTLSLPLFLSACYHFVFLTHTRTHIHTHTHTHVSVLIKVTKRVQNHIWQVCMWLISLITVAVCGTHTLAVIWLQKNKCMRFLILKFKLGDDFLINQHWGRVNRRRFFFCFFFHAQRSRLILFF